MADVIHRCGRRKQTNPKRKNVETEGVEPATKVQKTDEEKSDVHDSSSHVNMIHDTATDNHDNTEPQKNVTTEVVSTPDVKSSIVDTTPPISTKSDIPTTMADQKCTDDEKLRQYLHQTNTVVIYPEAVSDGEDGDNDEDDEDKANTSQELENCFSIDEDIVLNCAHCDLTFSRFNILRDHMREVHPDLPIKYLCPKCDEAFLLKSHLDKHLAMHSPTSQSCNICNKTFANVYRLQRHMISHDESTDLRKFKCPECGKAFKFKHHLKEHIRIHSGEKPFQCPNCSKRFSHSGSYSSHMTSKKCWVMNQNRACPSTVESASSTIRPGISTTMHSYPHPMMHFEPMKPGIPAYYSPAGARFLPMYHHTIRPVMTSLLPHTLSIQHSTPHPSSMVMATKQISPDVNSNTKVVTVDTNVTKEEPVFDKKESTPTLTSGPQTTVETYKCKFCCEIFASAVDCHQHERYMCKKDEHNTSSNASSDESKTNQSTSSEVITSDEKSSETLSCRFCDEVFNSPVSLHQHERYICKLNKDLVQRMSDGSPRNSPSSSMSDHSHILSIASASPETESEDQDDKDDNALNDSKKFRMRSLISDEQLHVLKSFYSINPRPRKYELIRIGNEIGFPKRVVQVWFQNMRARDRRRGKEVPYFPSMARFKRDSPSHSISDSRSSTPAILPVAAHGGSKKISNTAPTFEQPLDLSTRPAPAHSNRSSPASCITPPTSSHEVLNLSVKPEGQPSVSSKPDMEYAKKLLSDSLKDSMFMKTPPHKYPMDGKLQSSAIYKYMQQEGLFPGYFVGNPTITTAPSMIQQAPVHTRIIPTCEPAIITSSHPMYHHHHYSRPDTNNITISLQQKVHLAINKIHQARNTPKHDDDDSQSDSSSSSDSYHDRSQYNGVHFDAAMEHATHNLATLAEVSLADRANLTLDSEIKLKRMRKKSWRQVERDYLESEEIQLDLDDAMLDEDHPYRKKRRSWKNHRMEADDGLYGCDQCKKMFSKQSSLARHKYEHSGARPFNCEICHKAFKHKHHLTEHRRLHSGEKPFQCKKCGKRFSHSGSYSQHMNHRYKYCKPTREEFNCSI
ncbi:Hypothetical predicted protein [Mytilus galloprovincialis]|uniref:Uncharacterized protein n=2 Tax=Mytilus galloprovincialis TaxID=29158 RepID=A0A8B6FEI0_MYTGA|nr:Hypothetical predicted protein [Mytilus galloprovincialis]